MTKNFGINQKILVSIFWSLIFISFLYSFEFFEGYSNEYNIARSEALELQKENKKALAQFIKNPTNNDAFLNYIEANKRYELSKKQYGEIKKAEKVFGFKSLQLFLERLLPNLALLIYFTFNLYRSFRKEPNNIGMKLIHGVFIMYAFFQLFWIFQQFQDFSKPVYYIITAISAYLVGLAVYCIRKQEISAFKRLRTKLITVSYFSLKHTEGEKKEKMLEVLKEVADS